jgi:predicted PurR-regulated permease PerM
VRGHEEVVDGVPRGLAVAAGVVWRLALLVVAGVVVLSVLLRLRLVVVPLVVAVALAAVLAGETARLSRLLPRSVAALLVTVSATALLGAVVWWVVRAVRGQWDELVAGVSSGVDEVQQLLTERGVDTASIEQLQEQVLQALGDNQDKVASGVLSGATVLAEVLAGLALVVVLLFFLLRDGPAMWLWALRQLPQPGRVDVAGRAALGTLAGYLRGTAVLGAFDAVGIGTALAVLGVPLAVPLAALVFLGGFVPLVGATLTGAVAVLVALVAKGPVTAGLVLAAVVVVQQLESQVLAPVVLGRTLELHPVAVVVALSTGGVLAGILGAAAAVPLTASAWAVVRALRADDGAGAERREEATGAVADLSYPDDDVPARAATGPPGAT